VATDQAITESTQTAARLATSWWTRCRRAPLVLQAYLVFTIAYALLSIAAAFVRPLGNVITPFTGWTGGINYLFTLYFAAATAGTSQRKLVYIVIGFLGFFALGGVFELAGHVVAPDPVRMKPGNSALYFHELRPVVTIVLPLAWIMLLLSPGMRKWIKAPPDDESRRRQFSIADLLYLTLAVCLALGASSALYGQMHAATDRFMSATCDSPVGPYSTPLPPSNP
jgi:hypothetical protein